MNNDIIFDLVKEAQDEDIKSYIKKNAPKKLSIEELYDLESKHWYYIYRIKILKSLINNHIYGSDLKIADIG